MRVLFQGLLNPIVILWILILLFLIFSLIKKKVTSRIFLGLAAGWCFIISISPVPQWLIFKLESRYPVIDPYKIPGIKGTHILILGGGHSIAPQLPATDQLSREALGRLIEGIRLYRLIPESKIVCSGFSKSGRITQARMLALAALDLGVDAGDTLMINSPENTKQEASEYRRRFGSSNQLILVTNASHMPRAIKIFSTNGLNPIAAPTNHFIKVDPRNNIFDFIPSVLKIEMMQNAMYEYGALFEFFLIK